MEKINYPLWKTWTWRFVRSGIAGGAGMIVITAPVLQANFSNYRVYLMILSSSFITGFISAGALMLRDTFGNKRQTSVVDKMPI